MNSFDGDGCIVRWNKESIRIELRGRADGLVHGWTQGALSWDGSDIALLAARRLEWHVDLLVRLRDELSTVRLSPLRAFAPHAVLRSSDPAETRATRCSSGKVDGRSMGGGFEVEMRDRAYRLAPNGITGHYAVIESTRRHYDLFLSYKDADTRLLANDLAERVAAGGCRVWFAPTDVRGSIYSDQLADAIDRSKGFVVIWSGRTLAKTDEDESLAGWTQLSEIERIFASIRGRSKTTPVFHYVAEDGVAIPEEYIGHRYQIYRMPGTSHEGAAVDVSRFAAIILDDLQDRLE